MNNTFKIIDYVKVYQDRKIIDGKLYSRYFIHEDKPIGIPNGVSFYRKNESAKYVRLSSTDTVKGMSIRYYSKETQVSALIKLINIKNMQQDDRPTVDFRADEKRYTRTGINESLPPGVCVNTRTINNHKYRRVFVNVFCGEKNKFIQKQLYAGKVDDPDKLQETINKAIAMRKASMELAASLTQTNASKSV